MKQERQPELFPVKITLDPILLTIQGNEVTMWQEK